MMGETQQEQARGNESWANPVKNNINNNNNNNNNNNVNNNNSNILYQD